MYMLDDVDISIIVLGGKLYSMNEPWGYLLSSIIETLAS
jgi:hypothetical protein